LKKSFNMIHYAFGSSREAYEYIKLR